MTTRGLPTTPIERDPIEAYHGMSLAEVQSMLDQALDGVQLGGLRPPDP